MRSGSTSVEGGELLAGARLGCVRDGGAFGLHFRRRTQISQRAQGAGVTAEHDGKTDMHGPGADLRACACGALGPVRKAFLLRPTIHSLHRAQALNPVLRVQEHACGENPRLDSGSQIGLAGLVTE